MVRQDYHVVSASIGRTFASAGLILFAEIETDVPPAPDRHTTFDTRAKPTSCDRRECRAFQRQTTGPFQAIGSPARPETLLNACHR